MPRASTAKALMKKKEEQNRGIYGCDHRRQEAEIKLGFSVLRDHLRVRHKEARKGGKVFF